MSNQTKGIIKPIGSKTKELTLIGLMAALICIMGPLSIAIPISPVPISLTNFALYFVVYVLGMKRGTMSYCIYLLMGLVGLPVFSAFTSGPAKLLGPTGGYLIGFLFAALICGYLIDRSKGSVLMYFVGMVLGAVIYYLFGTVWLAFQLSMQGAAGQEGSIRAILAGMDFKAALAAGVYPFIIGDILKMVVCILIAPQVRRRLQKFSLY